MRAYIVRTGLTSVTAESCYVMLQSWLDCCFMWTLRASLASLLSFFS